MDDRSHHQNRRKYYRLLTEQKSHCRYKTMTPQKRTQQVIRNGNYLYIDVNEQSGLRQMEKVDMDDMDIDVENIGKNIICSLHNSSPQNQKTIDYIHRTNDFRKQKERFENLLKKKMKLIEQEQKEKEMKNVKKVKKKKKDIYGGYSMRFLSQEQIKKQQKSQQMRQKAAISLRERKKHKQLEVVESVQETLIKKIHSKDTPLIYHGMKGKKLKEYLQRKDMEKMNTSIMEKQRELIRNLGLLGEQELQKREKKFITYKKRRKVNLPTILASSAPRILSKQY